MKTLRKLATLLAIIYLTTPQIIETYKKIYKNYIKIQKEIEEKVKKAVEADIKIKTTYVDEDTSDQWTEKIKKRIKKQWLKIGGK